MADDSYKHGEMDIAAQEKTFEGFVKWSVRVGAICIGVVIFLAIFGQ